MKTRLDEIRERARKSEEWSQNCGNRPGEWSEGMYPTNFLARDIYALLSRIEALERVREAAKNHSCVMGRNQLDSALAAAEDGK